MARLGRITPRPRAKGPDPDRANNRPDKHTRERSAWVKSKKQSNPERDDGQVSAAQGGECVFDGVRYKYDRLPFSDIHFHGFTPEQSIRRMDDATKGRFGVVKISNEEPSAIIEGVREGVLKVAREGSEAKENMQPATSPERTLAEIREELLDLLNRAREFFTDSNVVVKIRRGEEVIVERRSGLSRGERRRVRTLKQKYKEAIAGPVMVRGNDAWLELLEERQDAA